MGHAPLVDAKAEAGRRLVRFADDHGVAIRAALWLYDQGEDRWSLVLEAGKPMGLREFARALSALLPWVEDPVEREEMRELLITDVRLFTKPHPVAQMLRPTLGKASSVNRTRVSGRTQGNYVIDDALLYRLERDQVL